MLGLLLIPMNYIHVGKPFSTTGTLENVRDAFVQMGNNHIIILATIGNKYTIDRQILSNLGGGPVPFKDNSYVCAPNINFLSP